MRLEIAQDNSYLLCFSKNYEDQRKRQSKNLLQKLNSPTGEARMYKKRAEKFSKTQTQIS